MPSGENLQINDVLKIAVTNETAGAEFYASMARSAEEEQARDIFNRLAEEEKEHRQLFQELVSRNSNGSGTVSAQTSSYVKMLADNNVFSNLEAELEQEGKNYADITPQEALGYGIQAEKDSILLYQELFESAGEESLKETLSSILAEEKKHLVELRQQMEEY